MTLRERMISWAGRHRDNTLGEIEGLRARIGSLRRWGASAAELAPALARLERLERRLGFWDDLYLRLSGAR